MWTNESAVTLVFVTAFAAAVIAVAPAGAQHHSGMGCDHSVSHHFSMYDPASETTVRGPVTQVKNVNPMACGQGMGGTHVLVNTGNDVVEVHLGPAAFLAQRHIEVAVGDIAEVVGSKVRFTNAEAVVAREIRIGETTWTLRDTAGRPLWMGGCCR
jgi:hypothetical protein